VLVFVLAATQRPAVIAPFMPRTDHILYYTGFGRNDEDQAAS
jgi:hypothetical protein